MASVLNPCVNVLDGRAREALEFYRSVLGGDLDVLTFGDMGTEGPLATQVMHGQLETPAGFTLMVADAPPEMVQVPRATTSRSASPGRPRTATPSAAGSPGSPRVVG